MDPHSFLPKINLPHTSQVNPAEWAYERLVRSINDFEEKLDNDHEVGGRMVNFGNHRTFHIEDLGFWGPDFVKFYGSDEEGQPLELIQHISQVSVLLVSLKKVSEKPRRIGFELMKQLAPGDD
jgi:hypothetical protein